MEHQDTAIKVFTNAFMIGYLREIPQLLEFLHITKRTTQVIDNVTHITYNMWVERQNRKRERQTVLRLSHDSIAQMDRATAF